MFFSSECERVFVFNKREWYALNWSSLFVLRSFYRFARSSILLPNLSILFLFLFLPIINGYSFTFPSCFVNNNQTVDFNIINVRLFILKHIRYPKYVPSNHSTRTCIILVLFDVLLLHYKLAEMFSFKSYPPTMGEYLNILGELK